MYIHGWLVWCGVVVFGKGLIAVMRAVRLLILPGTRADLPEVRYPVVYWS